MWHNIVIFALPFADVLWEDIYQAGQGGLSHNQMKNVKTVYHRRQATVSTMIMESQCLGVIGSYHSELP